MNPAGRATKRGSTPTRALQTKLERPSCAPFCDAAAQGTCDLLLPGTTCATWYDEGQPSAACIGSGIIGTCTATR